MAGILTRTVLRSPVVKWILHARIRAKDLNDVVFVGEDFVHVKQVKDHGHLEHIATKANFDARIQAASTLTIDPLVDDEDIFMKLENDEPSLDDHRIPPQCLVLTLDSNNLLFLVLRKYGDQGCRFVHQAYPLPRFDRLLFQPGQYLAVDPYSRAFAVAAMEREVIIYSTKPREHTQTGLRVGDQNWSPVATQRPLQVDGVIQHMEFLIPSPEDEGHIILLLILADQRRTRAMWIEWYANSDLHEAQVHAGQPLDVGKGSPSLLVPLRNASFLLVSGNIVTRWSNIICGSAVGKDAPLLQVAPSYPGASPRKPIWISWCRPRRSDDSDHLYLVREDGVVMLLEAPEEETRSSHAGEFECHVGSAFASLGDLMDPDILIAAGDMSCGKIYAIGHWATPIRVEDLNRSDTMKMRLVESLSNWASVTDMVTSTLPGKSQRLRDAVFVTSGRQPYGTVTELRRGVEARLSVYFELEGLRGVTDIWALPIAGVGRVLLVLAMPSSTHLLDVSSDADMEIQEVDETGLAFDTANETLAAGTTSDGKLVQITRRSIRVSADITGNFEDASRFDCQDSTILAAAIEPKQAIAATAERSSHSDSEWELVCYTLGRDGEDAMLDFQIKRKAGLSLPQEPLALTVVRRHDTTTAVVATAIGDLLAFEIEHEWSLRKVSQHPIPSITGGRSLCDSMAVLHPGGGERALENICLITCGLRDGRIHVISADLTNDFSFSGERTINFSKSSVKLVQPQGTNDTAYAMSGLDMCVLSWNGQTPASLNLQSIWLSDKSRPELAQGAVAACAHMPPAHLLSSPDLADSLIIVSGDEFLVATLDRTLTVVPRQMPVSGTPNRLIYAEQQRSLVCASMRYDVHHVASSRSHSKPEEQRQVWPVIDFIPSRGSEPSYTYEMQPGEKVYAMLEWHFKGTEGKHYSFILVAGSYTKSSGLIKGRITVLQPVNKNKNWAVVDVKESQKTNYDAPVYALAQVDDMTFVACVGSTVIALRFSMAERKWEQICPPFQLASPGIYTTAGPGSHISISTAEDSLVQVILKQIENTERGTLEPDADNTKYTERMFLVCSAPRADTLLSHIGVEGSQAMTLMSSKYGVVSGVLPPRGHHSNTSEIVFDASLPRSLTRIRQCNVGAPWKPPRLAAYDIDASDLIGCAADGTIVGLTLFHDDLWRRLSWLQRLCEWSEELSPHLFRSPPYSVGEQTFASNERAMPVGLGADNRAGTELIMRTSRSPLNDKHINGDVLARLFEGDGAQNLRRLIRQTAKRDDRAGEWVRKHLEEELYAVDGMVEILESLLDGWL